MKDVEIEKAYDLNVVCIELARYLDNFTYEIILLVYNSKSFLRTKIYSFINEKYTALQRRLLNLQGYLLKRKQIM